LCETFLLAPFSRLIFCRVTYDDNAWPEWNDSEIEKWGVSHLAVLECL
jgi:hypothetical protein